jgi:hypothetical protein
MSRAAQRAEGFAAIAAMLCIASFFCAPLFTDAFGSREAVARQK